MVSSGLAPASTAVAYTYGLKLEPVCRSAWVTRSNCDRLKSRPPTMANTSPVELSMDSSAASAPESCSSVARKPPPDGLPSTMRTYTTSPVFRNASAPLLPVHFQSSGVRVI